MKPEVLVVKPMMPHVMAALEEAYQLHKLYEADDREAFLADIGPAVRGIATDGGADAELMDALPNLEIVSSFGVGVDSVDVAHATARKIVVANTPDVLNDDVANLAVLLLLACSRRLVAYDKYVRKGAWLDGAPPLADSVRGRKVGILGLGRIGKDIAEKLAVFGCEVVYHGRREQSDVAYPYFADLEEMARQSDYLVVICPGGAATHNIVNRAVLDALGPRGTLINVARGSVVDEPELVAALLEGRLGGAGLDVFADEPRVPEALLGLDQVVLQPHQGSATVDTRRAMGDRVVDNLAAHFAGKGAVSRVN